MMHIENWVERELKRKAQCQRAVHSACKIEMVEKWKSKERN